MMNEADMVYFKILLQFLQEELKKGKKCSVTESVCLSRFEFRIS